MSECRTLTFDDILAVHNVLVADFASSPDPIEPSGVRDDGSLLHSAITRQSVGLGSQLKYPDALSNAATLCYGICCNHAFHNGNKRTALVSMLCHLDRNGLVLQAEVGQDELYSFMLKIASHKFAPKKRTTDSTDVEVGEIRRWLHRHTRQISKGERVVTFRQLRQILHQYHVELENPKGNYIDVIRYQQKRKHLFAKKEWIGTRVAHIPYPREGEVVGKKVLKGIRQQCGLTDADGVDSEMFYSAETAIDSFVLRYRGTLRRLAKV